MRRSRETQNCLIFGLAPGPRISKVSTGTGTGGVLVTKRSTGMEERMEAGREERIEERMDERGGRDGREMEEMF